MRIATWNVNSLRIRLDHVLLWLERQSPDVLCLQETKVTDDEFPSEELQRLGYSVAMCGEKSYNGVAILAKAALRDVQVGFPNAKASDPKRIIGATINQVRVFSCYIPNGKSIDAPEFEYKLEWLAALNDMVAGYQGALALCGDFNIARDERDVVDPKAFVGQTHFHPREHAALSKLEASGLQDVFRRHESRAGLYTWWDYRGGAFRRNQGMRIDYIYANAPLAARSRSCSIDREERAREKPSDHVPVIADFEG